MDLKDLKNIVQVTKIKDNILLNTFYNDLSLDLLYDKYVHKYYMKGGGEERGRKNTQIKCIQM